MEIHKEEGYVNDDIRTGEYFWDKQMLSFYPLYMIVQSIDPGSSARRLIVAIVLSSVLSSIFLVSVSSNGYSLHETVPLLNPILKFALLHCMWLGEACTEPIRECHPK